MKVAEVLSREGATPVIYNGFIWLLGGKHLAPNETKGGTLLTRIALTSNGAPDFTECLPMTDKDTFQYMSVVAYEDYLICFGGCTSKGVGNDSTYIFSMHENEWTVFQEPSISNLFGDKLSLADTPVMDDCRCRTICSEGGGFKCTVHQNIIYAAIVHRDALIVWHFDMRNLSNEGTTHKWVKHSIHHERGKCLEYALTTAFIGSDGHLWFVSSLYKFCFEMLTPPDGPVSLRLLSPRTRTP